MKNGALLLAVVFTSLLQVFGQINPIVTSEVLEEKLENLPLLFRQNMGQWDEQILFSGSGSAASVSS